MQKNKNFPEYSQFEEAFDELIIEKLDQCESLGEWNQEIISYFKNWTNENNEIFENVFQGVVMTAIAQNIYTLPLRNDFYRSQFVNWTSKNI